MTDDGEVVGTLPELLSFPCCGKGADGFWREDCRAMVRRDSFFCASLETEADGLRNSTAEAVYKLDFTRGQSWRYIFVTETVLRSLLPNGGRIRKAGPDALPTRAGVY